MKKPFITKQQADEIIKQYPTPFHIYDEKGIRENARNLYKAFSWNKGYKEYFAVKATPNPYLMKILQEEGFPADHLILELTERCKELDFPFLTQRVQQLHDAGIRVALDDMGTGFSTIDLLLHLPVDEMKLDMAFTHWLISWSVA